VETWDGCGHPQRLGVSVVSGISALTNCGDAEARRLRGESQSYGVHVARSPRKLTSSMYQPNPRPLESVTIRKRIVTVFPA
jgi:hypothetical protein